MDYHERECMTCIQVYMGKLYPSYSPRVNTTQSPVTHVLSLSFASMHSTLSS